MYRLAPLALACVLLPACLGTMDDNSLETFEVQPDPAAVQHQVSGVAQATAGAAEGDWAFVIGEQSWAFHSSSRADFSILSGLDLTLSSAESFEAPAPFRIDDVDGVRFVASATAGEDGSTWFGHPVWAFGEVLAKGVVVNAYEEPQDVTFMDVTLTADDGAHTLLPGAPASLLIDGAAWRVTVIAAYEPENSPNAKCDSPAILAIELLRTDSDAGQPLVRPVDAVAPMGMCG